MDNLSLMILNDGPLKCINKYKIWDFTNNSYQQWGNQTLSGILYILQKMSQSDLWQVCSYRATLAETTCHRFWRQREKGGRWHQILTCFSSHKASWIELCEKERLSENLKGARLEFRRNIQVKGSLNFWILSFQNWDSVIKSHRMPEGKLASLGSPSFSLRGQPRAVGKLSNPLGETEVLLPNRRTWGPWGNLST